MAMAIGGCHSYSSQTINTLVLPHATVPKQLWNKLRSPIRQLLEPAMFFCKRRVMWFEIKQCVVTILRNIAQVHFYFNEFSHFIYFCERSSSQTRRAKHPAIIKKK